MRRKPRLFPSYLEAALWKSLSSCLLWNRISPIINCNDDVDELERVNEMVTDALIRSVGFYVNDECLSMVAFLTIFLGLMVVLFCFLIVIAREAVLCTY